MFDFSHKQKIAKNKNPKQPKITEKKTQTKFEAIAISSFREKNETDPE